MAIGQAILIDSNTDIKEVSANYNENIVPYFCTFNTPFTWVSSSGEENAVIENSPLRKAFGDMSMLLTFTGTNEIVFSCGGDQMTTICEYDGRKTLSTAFYIESTYEDAEVSFTTVVFVNGVAQDYNTFQADIKASEGFIFDEWNTYAQKFSADKDDELTFQFKASSNAVGLKMFVDMFMVSQDDKKERLVARYIPPKKLLTSWQSRVDTTNTQSITADTNTNFGFVGISETNNSATLLTTTGLITPEYLNDVVTVDYFFDLTTPAGADNYIDVFLKVNGITYRAFTHLLIKGSGNPDNISGSFTLPVGQTFFDEGAQLVINSSVNITIGNRYISVVEHSK